MNHRVFVMYRLRSDVDMADYLDWSVNTDQRITPALDSIVSFNVFRVTERIEGKNGYDVLEEIEVTDVDSWRADNVSEHMAQIQEDWPKYADTESAVVLAALPITGRG